MHATCISPERTSYDEISDIGRDGNFSSDVAVIAYPTPAEGSAIPSTNHWQEIFRARNQRDSQFKDRFTKRKVAGGLVDPAREIDLTGKRNADGTLTWDVPEGNWTILRIGYCANGRINYPPSACGRGLECDKLSAKALDAHWAGFLDKLLAHFGPDLVGRRNGGASARILAIPGYLDAASPEVMRKIEEFARVRTADVHDMAPLDQGGRAFAVWITGPRHLVTLMILAIRHVVW